MKLLKCKREHLTFGNISIALSNDIFTVYKIRDPSNVFIFKPIVMYSFSFPFFSYFLFPVRLCFD